MKVVDFCQGQQGNTFSFIKKKKKKNVENNVKNVNIQQWLIVNNYCCESQKL